MRSKSARDWSAVTGTFVFVVAAGLVVYFFAHTIHSTETTERQPAVNQLAPMGSPVVNVNVDLNPGDIVLVPATVTPTPYVPTTTPAATMAPSIGVCGSPEPGKLCRVPNPPPPTPTPYPSCTEDLPGGAYCRWPEKGESWIPTLF